MEENNPLLEFYFATKKIRNFEEKDLVNMWKKARKYDKVAADSFIFYIRSIEYGLGEREAGRCLLKALAYMDSKKIERNLEKIVSIGRWDDLYCFIGTPMEKIMWDFIEEQFKSDLVNMRENKRISNLAKWLKSVNTSSYESRKIARKTCEKFELEEKTYRKILHKMREYLKIVECKMSENRWNEIDFNCVPFIAFKNYKNSFSKNCGEAYKNYIKNTLTKKEEKYANKIIFSCIEDIVNFEDFKWR